METIYRWIRGGELIVEIALGVVVFLAENDVFYPAPVAWAVVEFLMFGINLAIWLIVACYFTARNRKGEKRGGSLFSADSVYFAVTTVLHLLLSLGWIVYLQKSYAVSPLNWTANPAAYAVFRALFSRQYTFVVLLITFALFDKRYAGLKMKLKKSGNAEN